jgi:hypothetical protein
MGYIEENLLPGETIVFKTRLHWNIFGRPALALVCGLSLLTVSVREVRGVGIFLSGVGVVMALLAYIAFVSSEFGVTTQRVVIKVGFLRRRSLELFLQKVESIGVDQGILGRIFGYGSVSVIGTGGTKELFRKVAAPLEFRRIVQQQTPAPLQEWGRMPATAATPHLCIHCGKYYAGNPAYCPNCGHAIQTAKEGA